MNKSVTDLVEKFVTSKKPVASICHGQLILAAADSVRGRKCTAFPAVKPVLIAAGAHWVEPETMASCIVDGNLITGATYDGHPEFINLFVKALGGSITGSSKRILFLCGVSVFTKFSQIWLSGGNFRFPEMKWCLFLGKFTDIHTVFSRNIALHRYP